MTKKFVLCFLLREEKVCLAQHLRSPYRGKKNGYGGKREPGESVRGCAVREVSEECGVLIEEQDLEQTAFVRVYHADELVAELYVSSLANGSASRTKARSMMRRCGMTSTRCCSTTCCRATTGGCRARSSVNSGLMEINGA